MRLHNLWLHFQVSFLCCCHHKSQSLHPLAPTLQTWTYHLSYASSNHYLGAIGLSFHVLWPGKQNSITWYPLIVWIQHGYTFLDPFGVYFINPLGTSYFLAQQFLSTWPFFIPLQEKCLLSTKIYLWNIVRR